MIRHRLVLEAVLVVVLVAGCAKHPALTQTSAPAPSGVVAGSTGGGAAQQVARASQPGGPASMTARPVPSEFAPVADLRDIHFAFDKHDVRAGDAKILDANAAWLKANARDLLLIEGHCDERGTNEYNLALGERRAKATMNYLVSQGVAAARITVVSYGEERPVCTEHTEACWAKNRRAHFLVKRG